MREKNESLTAKTQKLLQLVTEKEKNEINIWMREKN